MNHWTVRFLALCIPISLLLAGCQSQDQLVVPVTGAEKSVPAQVVTARENVLQYVISSARLAAVPDTDWQLDNEEQLKGEYRFRCGDWLMVIWPANANEENERVVIINQAAQATWRGYVEPNGHVVDTAYTR